MRPHSEMKLVRQALKPPLVVAEEAEGKPRVLSMDELFCAEYPLSQAVRLGNHEVLLLPDFVSMDEQAFMLQEIGSNNWTALRNRRVQCFGGDPVPMAAGSRAQLPDWLRGGLVRHIHTQLASLLPPDLGEVVSAYNHVLVNEYRAGDFILPHTDGPLYSPITVTLSLGDSDCDMTFSTKLASQDIGSRRPETVLKFTLPSRCLVAFWGRAYTDMLHSVDNWCPPCRGFTPKLAQWYAKDLKAKGLEVIFISSDKGQTEFDSYLSEQPWFALPFADRARKAKLSDKFKVQGIPSLILLNPKDGSLITDSGRESVTQDPTGVNLPWMPKTALEILAMSKILGHNGQVLSLGQVQQQTDVLGLYFSASWCGPCHQFTPQLASTYSQLKAQGKRFEVLFVSSDKSLESFTQYFESMPWLALDFTTSAMEQSALSETFKVEGIPSLVLLDSKTGQVYNRDTVGEVLNDPTGKQFPWELKPCQVLTQSSVGQIAGGPVVFIFAQSDEEALQLGADYSEAVRVWRGEAEEGAICHGDVCIPTGGKLDGAEDVLFFVCGITNPAVQRVKELTKYAGNGMAILELSQQAFAQSSQKPSPRTVRTFVQQYLAGQVDKQPLGK
ncbi:hypothetical protein BASA81_006614 [Batrachochytrium salamandrivorans]|nr:hypothetical protein BASA81_006614 [Batrachochytrium salamandrivorans]